MVVSEVKGILKVTRMEKEEPLEKSSTTQARLGYWLLFDDDVCVFLLLVLIIVICWRAVLVKTEEPFYGESLKLKSEQRSYNISISSSSILADSHLSQTDVINIDAGTQVYFRPIILEW